MKCHGVLKSCFQHSNGCCRSCPGPGHLGHLVAWSCTSPPPMTLSVVVHPPPGSAGHPCLPSQHQSGVSQWGTAGNTLEISKDQWDCEKTDCHQKSRKMSTLCYVLSALKEGEKKPEGLHEQIELNRLFYQKQTYKTKR